MFSNAKHVRWKKILTVLIYKILFLNISQVYNNKIRVYLLKIQLNVYTAWKNFLNSEKDMRKNCVLITQKQNQRWSVLY